MMSYQDLPALSSSAAETLQGGSFIEFAQLRLRISIYATEAIRELSRLMPGKRMELLKIWSTPLFHNPCDLRQLPLSL